METKRSEKKKKYLAGKGPEISGSSFFAFQWSSGLLSQQTPELWQQLEPPRTHTHSCHGLVLALMEETEPVVTQAAAATPGDEATAGRDWRGA